MLGALGKATGQALWLWVLVWTTAAHAQVAELSWEAVTRQASSSATAQIEEALARGNPTLAASLVEQAQRNDPHSPALRALALQTWLELGNWEAAHEASVAHLRADPSLGQHVVWTHWAALAAVRVGALDDARALLDTLTRYADETPAAPVLLYNLAELQRLTGDVPTAIVHYQLSLSHAPSYPSAMLGLGAALEASGDVEAAQQVLRRLVAVDPALDVLNAPRFYLPDGQVHWLRALANEASGDYGAARGALADLSRSQMSRSQPAEVAAMTARLEERLARVHAGVTWIPLPGCTPQRVVTAPDGTHGAVLCQEGQLRIGTLDGDRVWQVATGLQHATGGRNLPARTAGIAMPTPQQVIVWSTSGERETVSVTRTGARAQPEQEPPGSHGMPVAVSPNGALFATTLQSGTVIEVRAWRDTTATTFHPTVPLQGVAIGGDRVAVRIGDTIEVLRMDNGVPHTVRYSAPPEGSLRAWALSGEGLALARAGASSVFVDRTDTHASSRRMGLPQTRLGIPVTPTALAVVNPQTVVVAYADGLVVMPLP